MNHQNVALMPGMLQCQRNYNAKLDKNIVMSKEFQNVKRMM